MKPDILDLHTKTNRHPVSFKTPTTPYIDEMPPIAVLAAGYDAGIRGIRLDHAERSAVSTARVNKSREATK